MIDNRQFTENVYYRGRVALYAILNAIGVNKGDKVALQSFTCVAVPEAVLAIGANPLYIDIKPKGFNMDAVDLYQKLTSDVRAIVVQHTYGIPADMDRIMDIANSRSIPVIEDCCHTFMSKYKGQTVGSFGIGSFYSFEWGKPLVAGVGGSAVVNDDKNSDNIVKSYTEYKLPSFTKQARIEIQYRIFKILYRPSLFWPVRTLFHNLSALGLAEGNYNPVGEDNLAEDFNLKMAPFVKKRLLKKKRDFETCIQHSRWVAKQYRDRIQSNEIAHPLLLPDTDVVFARYPLVVKNKLEFLADARKNNVELAEWYATPIHPLKEKELALVHYETGSCPNAEQRCREVVTLPTHQTVMQRDIERTVNFLNKIINK